jgi:proteasome activator subunit 4
MDLIGELEDDYFEQTSDDLSSIDTTDELPSDCLDFKEKTLFQKEILTNRLLPYADRLNDEADALLAKIKANLGRSVMLRKIKPDCIIWSNMLYK